MTDDERRLALNKKFEERSKFWDRTKHEEKQVGYPQEVLTHLPELAEKRKLTFTNMNSLILSPLIASFGETPGFFGVIFRVSLDGEVDFFPFKNLALWPWQGTNPKTYRRNTFSNVHIKKKVGKSFRNRSTPPPPYNKKYIILPRGHLNTKTFVEVFHSKRIFLRVSGHQADAKI